MQIDLDRDIVSGLCTSILNEAKSQGTGLKRTHVLNALARGLGYPHGAALQHALKQRVDGDAAVAGDDLETCHRLASEYGKVHGSSAARALRIARDQGKAPVIDVYRVFLKAIDEEFLVTPDWLWKKLGEFPGGFEIAYIQNVDDPAPSAGGDPERATWQATRRVVLYEDDRRLEAKVGGLTFDEAWKLIERMPHPDEALEIPGVKAHLRDLDRERARPFRLQMEMDGARRRNDGQMPDDEGRKLREEYLAVRKRLGLD